MLWRTSALALVSVAIGVLGLGAKPWGADDPPTIRNPGFESGAPAGPPEDWFVSAGAVATVVAEGAAEGERCVKLTRSDPAEAVFTNLLQSISAQPFRGKRIALSASVRFEGPAGGRAQMWLRADRPGGEVGFFDNMQDRPITVRTWAAYTIFGDIDEDAESLSLGFFVLGGGAAWIDDVGVRVVGAVGAGSIEPRELDNTGAANLVALAKLFGVVRYFHPSDESRALDWNDYTVRAVQGVEGAGSPQDLAWRLGEWTAPIAPTVRVWFGAKGDNTAPPLPPEGATHIFAMRYVGFASTGDSERTGPYSARRVKEPLGRDDAKRDIPGPGTVVVLDLGRGVWAAVPVAVYSDGRVSLPRASARSPETAARPRGWAASTRDRATRLAAVCVGWSTLRHFYPYFDVVPPEWDGALEPALRKAARDKGAPEFWRTLALMHAHLHDGHGWVGGPGAPSHAPRDFEWTWVGDSLVVSAADAEKSVLRPGDVVLSIDGRSVADLYADVAPAICAATEQWRRARALRELGWPPGSTRVTVRVRRAGEERELSVDRDRADRPFTAPHPPSGSEVAPGIVYFNLDGAETPALERAMPALVAAEGVIFDLRGYPGSAGAALLPHLTDKPVVSAKWNVPVITMPDFQRVTYEGSNWNLPPAQPRITAPVVFLTGGGAISYAESCMGIVEGMKLGEIVGGTTAGTNGNVTAVQLPGGNSLSFTGMRVIKHDGSVHHTVGVRPTVPVTATVDGLAGGRDEVLERGVEVLRAKLDAAGAPK